MKKSLKIVLLSTIVMLLFFTTTIVFADESTNKIANTDVTNDISKQISEKTFETKDVYAFDQKVNLSDSIKGNMFANGQDVTISNAMVYGDIFVFGQNITIDSSDVYGNIFVLGQNINIKGSTTVKTVYACGQNIKIENPVDIAYSLKVAGENLNISGRINEVYASGDKIIIGKQTIINGAFEYTSNNEATIEEGASINKSLVKFNKIEVDKKADRKQRVKKGIYTALTTFATIAVFSLIFTLWDKKYSSFVKSDKPWIHILKSVLIGLASVFFAIVAVLLVACTLVGIKISIAMTLMYLLILFLASSASTTAVAKMIFKKDENRALYGKTILVALVYSILSVLPYVGEFIIFLFISGGTGMILRRLFRN